MQNIIPGSLGKKQFDFEFAVEAIFRLPILFSYTVTNLFSQIKIANCIAILCYILVKWLKISVQKENPFVKKLGQNWIFTDVRLPILCEETMMFKLVGWQKECSTFYKWMSVLCAPLCKQRIFHKKAMSPFFSELFVFSRGGRK